ncbi:hypothetical protein IAT40_004310 [Kwoniella sp. CBS 6097]
MVTHLSSGNGRYIVHIDASAEVVEYFLDYVYTPWPQDQIGLPENPFYPTLICSALLDIVTKLLSFVFRTITSIPNPMSGSSKGDRSSARERTRFTADPPDGKVHLLTHDKQETYLYDFTISSLL